jgi:putative lipoprotein
LHTRVRCYVRLPADAGVRPGARVRVAIEDVSLADVPARTVAAADFPAPSSPGTIGPFELDADLADSRAEYAVRVHVDQTGDGSVAPGDLVSTTRQSISPHAKVADLQIPVTAVPEAP